MLGKIKIKYNSVYNRRKDLIRFNPFEVPTIWYDKYDEYWNRYNYKSADDVNDDQL